MPVVVSTHSLSKKFRVGFWKTRTVTALDGLDLEIHRNEIFGYLGPNGAGKSTTLKLLMALIYPCSGHAEILGQPVTDVSNHRILGFLPENPYFYEYLTAEEFLTYYAGLFGFSSYEVRIRVDRFLRLTGIADARKLQLRKFSKGMIQRAGIAQALINDPEIVFLDEPMSGLDPIGRREVRNLILRLKAEGKTVFFSSHILNDIETLCDRVAILNRGRLVGAGLLKDLISKQVSHVEIIISGMGIDQLRQVLEPAVSVSQVGTTMKIEVDADTNLNPLVSAIECAKGKIISVNPVRQTMEDYFLKVIQGGTNNPPRHQ
jgi:ABC-2 type transport system ATP-binding protein